MVGTAARSAWMGWPLRSPEEQWEMVVLDFTRDICVRKEEGEVKVGSYLVGWISTLGQP